MQFLDSKLLSEVIWIPDGFVSVASWQPIKGRERSAFFFCLTPGFLLLSDQELCALLVLFASCPRSGLEASRHTR